MFSKEERSMVYIEAIKKWGEDSQINVAIEEMGELIKCLAKRHRKHNGSTTKEIQNEIADVIVMMESLSQIFGEDNITNTVYKKTERLNNWLNNNKEVW